MARDSKEQSGMATREAEFAPRLAKSLATKIPRADISRARKNLETEREKKGREREKKK